MPAAATVPTGDGGDSRTYFAWTVGIALIYSAVHISARLLASPNLGEDDPLTNILIQEWAAGYSVWYPPMFEWMAWCVEQIAGPSLLGFQLLKYGLLIGTIGAIYWAAFYVTGHALWSLITAEALTLIYHIGWRFHEGFTGIIPAMFFSALALCFVLRILRGSQVLDFCWLGLALGCGLLSTHNFAIGIAAFFLAALLVPSARAAFYRWPLILTVVIAGVVVSPYYVWIVSDAGRLGQLSAVTSVFTHSNPHINPAKALRKTLGIPFAFFWSLLIFLLLGSLHRVRDHFRQRILPVVDWHAHPLLALLGLYAVIAYVLLFAAAFGLSYVRYASHDLLAFMVPVLVLLFGAIFLVEPTEREMHRWGRICLAIIVFAFVARAANMFVQDPVCKICRWGVPYDQLAQRLASNGAVPKKIIVFEQELGGNLRLKFPASLVELTSVQQFKPDVGFKSDQGAVALVWQVGGRNGLYDPKDVLSGRLNKVGLADSVQEFRAPWEHLFKQRGYRHTVWRYLVVQDRARSFQLDAPIASN